MSKPSVGIVTLHRVHNFGSALQAFATQNFLNANGFDSFVVDYWRPTELDDLESQLRYNFSRWNSNSLMKQAFKLVRGRHIEERAKNFRSFIEGKLNLSPQSYYSKSDLEKSFPQADYYCTGSDQIWNADYHVEGADPFFLRFLPEDRPRFSFSSSFGKKQLTTKEVEYVKNCLPKFKGISVREASAVGILAAHNLNAEHLVDPTLLTSAEEWRKLAKAPDLSQKYLLVYQLHRTPGLDLVVEKIAKEKKLRPVYLRGFWKPGAVSGRGLNDTSVEQFLGLLANASYVVTDSFHGTAFSLNLGIPFTVVLPNKYGERLQSLLALTNNSDRIVSGPEEARNTGSIDAIGVQGVLLAQRKHGAAFLKRMLE